jgi:hypothetical protein
MGKPFLDVSEVLVDPDFADTFDVTRSPEVVNSFGESTVPVPQVIPGKIGVVTMASPNDLDRLPEGDNSSRTISIVTKFRLQGPSPGFKPDVVTWRGDNYVVKLVEPYVQYGAGFIQALAGSIDTQQAAPSGMG